MNNIQDQIIKKIGQNAHGRILASPRIGKSRIIIETLKKDNPGSILWVTPSSELAKKDIPSEFDKWGYTKEGLKTITWASLHKEEGYYDLIILDEEQFITSRNSINLICGKLRYGRILSMTGTPSKHREKTHIYNRLKLPILVNLEIKKATDIGILSNHEIKIVKAKLGETKTYLAGSKNRRFFTTERKNYEYLNKNVVNDPNKFTILARMRAIKNSPSKFETAKRILNQITGRVLIFGSTIKQTEALCNESFHSKTDKNDLNNFCNEKIERISLVNSGGIGFTYKNIDHLLMVQVDSDKNGLTSQKICRSLLKQGDHKTTIWIISLEETQDQQWLENALKNFDKRKITYQSI